MFSVEERERLRAALVSAARADPRVAAVAVTGSAALDREDRWSDIDLALRLFDDADEPMVVSDWTARMYAEPGAVHHVDEWGDGARFRVFLLANTLQVDIAFWPWAAFGATGPAFRLLYGAANERPPRVGRDADELVGLAWLYGLHVRSSLARGRLWQAEYMVSAMRDHVLALASRRHGLPTAHARGVDALPAEVLATVADALVGRLAADELSRAFTVVTEALLAEARHVDPALADRIAPALHEIAAG